MENRVTKISISPNFRECVHAHAQNLLQSNTNAEFSNSELIENGRAISEEVVSNLNPDEIYSLMSFNSSELDYVVLSSGQTPALPDTPYSGILSNRDIIEPVLFTTAVHALLKLHPVVYEGENDGRIVRNVVPAKKSASAVSSHGSLVAFGGHVDNPDLPFFDDVETHSVTIPDNLFFILFKTARSGCANGYHFYR